MKGFLHLIFCDNPSLYQEYSGDQLFCFETQNVAQTYLYHFQSLASYFWIKTIFRKSKIAGIGARKGVQVAICGLHCIDLYIDTLKILRTHFSYNEKLKEEKKFYKTVTDIQ